MAYAENESADQADDVTEESGEGNELDESGLNYLVASSRMNIILQSVTIPDSVKEIGVDAFRDNNLSGTLDLTTYDNLEKIGNGVFGLNNLEKVKIGRYIEFIGDFPFQRNPNLESIIIDDENQTYVDLNGRAVYHPATNSLIQGTTQGYIPDGTESIGTAAFADYKLSEITLPDTVKRIEENAFSREKHTYTEIHLPKSVDYVGTEAFDSPLLKEVYVYNSETRISPYAFFRWYNQSPSEDLTIYGYANSTAEAHANQPGLGRKHTFIPFSEIVVDGAALPIQLGQLIEVIDSDDNLVATLQIPNAVEPANALDDATLEVKIVDPIVATGLAKAGAVLNFTFRDALGNEIEVSGDFELALFVDDATEDIAIYHEVGQDDWTNMGGTVANNVITATVNDFSKYGVFYADATNPTTDPITDPSTDSDPDTTVTIEESTVETDSQLVTGSGKLLPSTATSWFNIIALGAILLFIGVITILLTRRKRSA